MGKVSPKDKSKTPRQKRRLRSSNNKYLRPGALAQLRYSKASTAKSCLDIGKKRVVVLDTKKAETDLGLENEVIDDSIKMSSPDRFGSCPVVGPVELMKQSNLLRTPRTPRVEECESESRLESLPMDLLV